MDNAVPSPVSEKPSPSPSLRKVLVYGLLLIFFDAFFLDLGVLSKLVVIVVFLRIVFAAFLYYFFKRSFSWQLVRHFAIYVAVAVLIQGLIIGQNALAFHRAKNMVEAVEAYHAKYSNYPESLETMVPEFLNSVPLAKYTVASHSFFYWKIEKNNPTFFYMIAPPFFHNNYDFEAHRWHADD